MGGHDAEVEFGALFLESVGNFLQRLARRFRRIAFEDGGVGAVRLLAHRIVIRRGEDGDVLAAFADFLKHDVARAALMRRVLVGMQQADDDAFHVERDQFLRSAARAFLTQRDNHGSRHIDTLDHTARQLTRNQRRIVVMGVEMDAILIGITQIALDRAAHAVKILHAGIDDQAAFQTLALHDAVQHGGAGIDAGL